MRKKTITVVEGNKVVALGSTFKKVWFQLVDKYSGLGSMEYLREELRKVDVVGGEKSMQFSRPDTKNGGGSLVFTMQMFGV